MSIIVHHYVMSAVLSDVTICGCRISESPGHGQMGQMNQIADFSRNESIHPERIGGSI